MLEEIRNENAEAAAYAKNARELNVVIKGVTFRVPMRSICYAESFGRKIVLHLQRGEMEYYEKISDLERELGAPFYRVHRSYIVNMNAVRRYSRKGALMQNGDLVWISKYKYADFDAAYRDFARQG